MNIVALKGVATDISFSLIAVLTALACIPIYLQSLSVADYGVWVAISSVVAIIAFLDVGIDQSLTNSAIDDNVYYQEKFLSHLKANITIKFFIVIVMAIITSIVAWQIENLVNIGQQSSSLAAIALAIGIINLAIGMYLASLQSILFARKKFVINSISINIIAIGNSAIPVALLHFGYSIIAFPIAALISTLVSAVIVISRFKGKEFKNIPINPWFLFSINSLKSEHIHLLATYTTAYQLLKITSQLRTHALLLILNSFLGPAVSAKYALSARLPGIASQFAAKVFQPFYPHIGESFYSDNKPRSAIIIKALTLISIRLSVFLLLLLCFINEIFVKMWVGHANYLDDASGILIVFNAMVIVAFCNLGNFIFVSGSFAALGKMALLEIMIGVGLGIILHKHWGVAGVIIAFSLGSVAYFSYLVSHVFNTLQISMLDLFKNSIGYVVIPSAMTLSVLILWFLTVETNNWWDLFWIAVVSTLANLLPIEFRVICRHRKSGWDVVLANLFPFADKIIHLDKRI